MCLEIKQLLEVPDIPKIVVQPRGEVTIGYETFTLDLSGMRYQPVERDLLIQHLRTHEQETLSFSSGGAHELRLEDYVVRGLIDRDDVDYDSHADFLYGLSGQVVEHIKSYLSEDETRNVLIYHQKQIAAFVYAQMQAHQQESAVEYDVEVKKGFTKLKGSAYTAKAGEPEHDFRQTVGDKSQISKMVFGGFQRCLFAPVKFQSDTERRLSIIIDCEAAKWLRPAKGQFLISTNPALSTRNTFLISLRKHPHASTCSNQKRATNLAMPRCWQKKKPQ